jgi:hypothetical protein
LLKQALTGLGKALVVVLGVGYGVARALDSFSPDGSADDFVPTTKPPVPTSTETPKPEIRNPAVEATIQRVDRVEERLTRLESSVEALGSSVEAQIAALEHATSRSSARTTEHFVTRAELSAAMEQFASTLDTDIQRRFDIQNRSVQSLRTMVARTDELLEQVLETIESSGIPA